MSVDNVKLRTKSLIPLVIMAVLFAGVIGFGATRMLDQQASSGQVTDHSFPAILKMARVGRLLVQIGNDVHKSLVD